MKHSQWFEIAQAVVPLGAAGLGIGLTAMGVYKDATSTKRNSEEVRSQRKSEKEEEYRKLIELDKEKRLRAKEISSVNSEVGKL